MTKPDLSIIIPHKRGANNNKALLLNISRLQAGTVHSYELLIDTTIRDPYQIWNEQVRAARADIVVMSNSDVIMANGWDVPMVQCMEYNAIVTGYLVEPGTIGVASQNIQADYGRLPDNFNVESFERYVVAMFARVPFVTRQRGWYMPCAVNREWFLSTGGFDTTLGFPNPNDILFWERCIKEFNTSLIRVASFAYHFQNLSGRD